MGTFRPQIVAVIERRLWAVIWSDVQGQDLQTNLRNALSSIVASLYSEATCFDPWIQMRMSWHALLPNLTQYPFQLFSMKIYQMKHCPVLCRPQLPRLLLRLTMMKLFLRQVSIIPFPLHNCSHVVLSRNAYPIKWISRPS